MELVTIDLPPGRDAGRAFGAAVADRLPSVWAAYLNVFDLYAGISEADAVGIGLAAYDLVAEWRPVLAEELAGVAEGAGVPLEVVATLNARTEVVVGAECATVGRVGATPWLAQNWDWFLDAPERCVVVARPGWTAFTEVGILAKIGVSAGGLALSLDILRHTSDRRRPVGVPIHLLLREVLGSCRTVEEAAAVLDAVEVSASSCLTVVDAQGGGAMFEVSPDGVARIEADPDGFFAHTNNFLDPKLAEGDDVGAKMASSCGRRDDVVRLRPSTLDAARAALSSHAAVPLATCRHGAPNAPGLPFSGTAACLLMDPVAGTLDVAPGPPCRTPFERFTAT